MTKKQFMKLSRDKLKLIAKVHYKPWTSLEYKREGVAIVYYSQLKYIKNK